jgi:hypothetical protein
MTFIGFLIAFVAGAGAAYSEMPRSVKSEISVTYAVPNELSLGEPVVVEAMVRNLGSEEVTCSLDYRKSERLRFAIRGPEGDRAFKLSETGGFQDPPVLEFKPGQSKLFTFFLNEAYDFKLEGKYEIRIDYLIDCTDATGKVTQYPSHWSGQLIIGPRNDAVMRDKCIALVNDLLRRGDPHRSSVAYYKLFYTKNPIWIALTRPLFEARRYIGFEENLLSVIARYDTADAYEILLLAAKSPQAYCARTAVLLLKRKLPTVRDPSLKAKIEEVAGKQSDLPASTRKENIRGVITSIGTGVFNIRNDKIVVAANTMIMSNGQVLSFADLKTGGYVSVYGDRQADGSFLALLIQLVKSN